MNQVTMILRRMQKKEVELFLLDVLQKHDDVLNDFLESYGVAGHVSAFVNKAKGAMESFVDMYAVKGFVDYDEAYGFYTDIYILLKNTVDELVSYCAYVEALDFVAYTFEFVTGVEADDSGGGLSNCTYACREHWANLLSGCTLEEKRESFRWFLKFIEKNYFNNNCIDDVMEVFLECFVEREFLLQKQKVLLNLIKQAQKKDYDFYMSPLLVYSFRNMLALDVDEQKVEEFLQKYWHIRKVREVYAEILLERKDFVKAISVLQRCKVAANGAWWAEEYRIKLLDLYQEIGNDAAYKKELLEFVYEDESVAMKYIDKAKLCCDAVEWKKLVKHVTQHGYNARFALMDQEEMYAEMWEQISMDFRNIRTLDYYEPSMRKHFPVEVRDFYIAYLHEVSKNTASRQVYEDWVLHLKKLKRYPDGVKLARQIASEWREQYKRRRALLEILHANGFLKELP